MKKLLITGSSGLLGGSLNFNLNGKYDTYGIFRTTPNPDIKNQFNLDLISKDETRKVINKINPDFVVHCAALTNVEMCEIDHELAYQNNILSTLNLVESISPEARFIYISTDSVFDGSKGNYSEEDEPAPLNNYGKTKLEGEKLVREKCKNYIIIRTNFFGWNMIKGESFAEWIINSLTQGKAINMFTDAIFSPMYVETLSKFIERLIDSKVNGIINIASRDSLSKYEFGIKLAKRMKLTTNLINPTSVDEFNFKAKRPKNTSLDTARAIGLFGKIPIIEEEIDKFCKKNLENIKNKFSLTRHN